MPYAWAGLFRLLVVPSPKCQTQLLTCPEVMVVNATFSGAAPLPGFALKRTTGAEHGTLKASSCE